MEFTDLKTQYRALKEDIDARMRRVLEHGQFILGPEVRELEEKLAAYTGARHCVTVASGTEALLIALMALDIKPGDEVVTTPFTFIATAEMIMLLGAKPVFVDVEEDTANIDASRIAAAVTSKTRAIMPVSLYGQPADMDEINAIAAQRLGIETIRGSGGRYDRKGGVGAFREMVDALAQGYTVALTADVPKVSRIVGLGIVMLARESGRPIFPIAVATSRRVELDNWDRSAINLPFSRGAMVGGKAIRVAPDADDAELESCRRAVEAELNLVTARAYALVDRPGTEPPHG